MEEMFWLTMRDETEIYVKKWADTTKQPRAIIQLAHGMVEHIHRYEEFATFLVREGFLVYGHDHRGHGRTGERQGTMGYFAEKDGFEEITKDMVEVTARIRKDHPTVPLFLFGHSMGSFIARNFVQDHSDLIDGLILSGTGYYPRLLSMAGKKVSEKFPPKQESPLMHRLLFTNNNKKVSEQVNGFEWLSRDKELIEDFINDPLAGFTPKGRFFYDLLNGIIKMEDSMYNRRIRKDLPVLFISGEEDPIGNYTKGTWKTARTLDEAGLQNVAVMFFTGGRHELINEINREEVFEIVHKWLDKQLR